MIRLFAPPTSDAVLGRNAMTAGNLLLHVLAVILLAVPIGRAVKEGLLDRLVVYLVPPDRPSGEEHGMDNAPISAAPVNGGREVGAPQSTHQAVAEQTITHGDLPALSSAKLAATSRQLTEAPALTELEVDSAVVRDPSSAAPEYPSVLLQKRVEGSAAVLYVVDTLGVVDTTSYRVVAATHTEFGDAVRRALPGMHFRPAVQHGQKVRQLVQQTFRFRITTRDTVRAPEAPPPSE